VWHSGPRLSEQNASCHPERSEGPLFRSHNSVAISCCKVSRIAVGAPGFNRVNTAKKNTGL
jgi:hypothetical protein